MARVVFIKGAKATWWPLIQVLILQLLLLQVPMKDLDGGTEYLQHVWISWVDVTAGWAAVQKG